MKGANGQEPSTGESGPAPPRVEDPFGPAELRIHPLTRIVEAETPGQVVIEAYFELLDAWGHTTKALGRLEVELTTEGASGGAGTVRWTVDLRDPEENSTQRFDEATRTYRLRLVDAPAELARASDAELRASFTDAWGTRLTASRRLHRGGQ